MAAKKKNVEVIDENESPSMGKMPVSKKLSVMNPVEMECGFVRPCDISIGTDGRFYIDFSALVSPKISEPHEFIIPIQNVDCGKFVIEIPTLVSGIKISDEIRNSKRHFKISGVSFEYDKYQNLTQTSERDPL